MKSFLIIVMLFISTVTLAHVPVPNSINCWSSYPAGSRERYSYTAVVEKNSNFIKVTKFIGGRGGGSAVWSSSRMVRFLNGRGLLNVSDNNDSLRVEILLETEQRYGYTGPGVLIIKNLEVPLNCSVGVEY